MEDRQPTPHPLRSTIACRYLMIICKTVRGDNDDIEEYIRRFELCEPLVSKEHTDMQSLVEMLFNGLPLGMVHFMHRTYLNDPRKFKGSGTWPPEIPAALLLAKHVAATVHGVPSLLRPEESSAADKLLARHRIKPHHRSDPEANAAFESLYLTLTSSDEDQLRENNPAVTLALGSVVPIDKAPGSSKAHSPPSAVSKENLPPGRAAEHGIEMAALSGSVDPMGQLGNVTLRALMIMAEKGLAGSAPLRAT